MPKPTNEEARLWKVRLGFHGCLRESTMQVFVLASDYRLAGSYGLYWADQVGLAADFPHHEDVVVLSVRLVSDFVIPDHRCKVEADPHMRLVVDCG